ncbi:MAG TPA: PIN domain-containing protein [Thermoanaerobaculia bacterium]|jgi:predicted nucleic acid-binding protein
MSSAVEIVADTSVWIDHLERDAVPTLAAALLQDRVVLSPLVVAELVTGAVSLEQRQLIGELLQDVPLHLTTLGHWLRVGELRQRLLRHGLKVTLPDAHIAQCALDRNAVLLSRDAIFARIAKHVPLRLGT